MGPLGALALTKEPFLLTGLSIPSYEMGREYRNSVSL